MEQVRDGFLNKKPSRTSAVRDDVCFQYTMDQLPN